MGYLAFMRIKIKIKPMKKTYYIELADFDESEKSHQQHFGFRLKTAKLSQPRISFIAYQYVGINWFQEKFHIDVIRNAFDEITRLQLIYALHLCCRAVLYKFSPLAMHVMEIMRITSLNLYIRNLPIYHFSVF